MKITSKFKTSKVVSILLSFLCLGISILLFVQYNARNKALIEKAISSNQEKVNAVAFWINEQLTKNQEKADNLAVRLSNLNVKNSKKYDSLCKTSLRSMLYSNPDFIEAGVAFEPYKYNSSIRLAGMAYIVEENRLKQIILDDKLDYTKQDVLWYNYGIKNGPMWLDPEYDTMQAKMLSIYATPFTTSHNTSKTDTIGVLYLKQSLNQFSQALNKLDLGEEGSYFILSDHNKLILHSNISTQINSLENPYNSKWLAKDNTFKNLIKSSSYSNKTHARFTDKETGLESILLYGSIPVNKWSLYTVIVTNDHKMPPIEAKRKILQIGFSFGLSLLLLIIPLINIRKFDISTYWKLSYALSFFCFFMSVFVLVTTISFPIRAAQSAERITNQHTLNKFKIKHAKQSLNSRQELPVYIPTGVFIQAVSFINAFDVQLSGYIWQKYRNGIHDSISRCFVMPEGEHLEMEKAYTKKGDNYELIGWNFRVILHEKFNYSRYPFVRENIWVQLWHKDFHNDVILIPDLEAYDRTNPSALPGLLDELEIPGWDIESSNFSIKSSNDKINFGFNNNLGASDIPELYFNTHIVKEITGPIVTHMIPLFIVLILLFAILLLTNRDERRNLLLGYNTLAVIATCAGFFLVVVFSHIDLRKHLSTNGIVYIESYYFIIYIFLLGVALNSLIYTLTENRLAHFKDNQIIQMLFLPLSQMAILIITLIKFY